MTATAAKRMNAAEFLPWAEPQEKRRYDLFRGEIVAMAPDRAAHVAAKARIWRALSGAIAPTPDSLTRRLSTASASQ